MNPAVGLSIGVTVFTTMLALGLGLEPEGLRQWCSRPALPLRVLLGSCVLVPLLGLLLLQSPWSWTLAQPERTAIALMVLCPSAPLALRRARAAGGDHQLAALLQVGAALLAIITVPLLGLLFRWSFGVDGWEAQPIDVALQVGQIQVLPLLLGLLLRRRRPRLADRLQTPLERLANGLLILLVLIVILQVGPLLWAYLPGNLPALFAMALLAVGSLWIGRALGGGRSGHGLTTALVTAMRNPGLALLFASRYGQALPGLSLAILLYVLVTLVVSLPLVWLPHRSAGQSAALRPADRSRD
ncbi:MAG: bile acid:sodium symporter [Cyanobium sp.]